MTRTDTHVHVVGPDRSAFPLQPRGLGRQWWDEPDRDAASLVAVLDAHGVGRALVVQAVGVYGYDNRYVLHAAAAAPDRLAAVPAVDLDDRSNDDRAVAAAIRRLAREPSVVGVRLFAVAPGSWWTGVGGRARAALTAAAGSGLVAVLTVFAHQLAELTPVIAAEPDAIVALDHCAFPALKAGRIPADAPVLRLREAANVFLKVSTHLLLEAAPDGDASGLVRQLADTFGAGRLLWGSDFPQTGGDYAALVAAAATSARSLDPEERHRFFGANAAALFRAGGDRSTVG